ncbi:MAG: hypothetical protein GY749_50385 [Desulfobacteraceae bacterium]|nr:hypothetical protein [Desulfobacteraceae bacterium]
MRTLPVHFPIFSLTEKQSSDLQEHDDTNAAFWQKLTASLQMTLDILKEIAEEKGFDPDSEDIDWNGEPDHVIHLISHMSEAYSDMVDDWLDYTEYLFDETEDEYTGPRLVVPGPPEDEVSPKDAADVIRWYQHQIHVKLERAVTSAQDEKKSDSDDYPRGSDGSAKVALIGIDRSVSAWNEIIKHFPDYKDDILKFIVYLGQLRKRVENEFPDARAFVRPGIDEV